MKKIYRFLEVTIAIARVTFKEIIRDKVLYNAVLCALLLLALGYFGSQLTFVKSDRIVLDFGVSAIVLSCGFIAILIGAPLLGREIERRTIFVALSRPISKIQFVTGKFLGIAGILTLNWVILVLVFAIIYWATSGVWNPTIGTAFLLALLNSFLLAAFSIFFSSWSTTSLAVIMTLGVYMVGTNISQLRFFAAKSQNDLTRILLDSMSYVFPNLEYYHLGTKVTYGLPLSVEFVAGASLYALIGMVLCLMGSALFIHRKDF